MSENRNCKNYFTDGGNTLVIGGKLVLEGEDRLLPFIPDSEATTVGQMKADHNALLAALRTAGLMCPASVAEDMKLDHAASATE